MGFTSHATLTATIGKLIQNCGLDLRPQTRSSFSEPGSDSSAIAIWPRTSNKAADFHSVSPSGCGDYIPGSCISAISISSDETKDKKSPEGLMQTLRGSADKLKYCPAN
jgi:hypothetical protein